MSKTQQKADLAIDRFVARVNQSPREPLPVDEVPEFLRDGPTDPGGWDVPWVIRPAPSPCPWVDAFEARLPGRLPRSYKSLVTRYLFPPFEVGPVKLFANTGGEFVTQPERVPSFREFFELVDAVFTDRPLCEPLLAAGFVQFGRAVDSYDPVCFDLNRRANSGECPIVQVDHESPLLPGRVEAAAELAPSFLELVGA